MNKYKYLSRFKFIAILSFVIIIAVSILVAQTAYNWRILSPTGGVSSTGNTVWYNINAAPASFPSLSWTTTGTFSTCTIQVDYSTNASTVAGQAVPAQTCTATGSTIITTSTAYQWVRVSYVLGTGGGLLTFVAQGCKNNTCTTGGGGGGGNSASFPATNGSAQNTWQIQTVPCASNPNCTQINGDGKVIVDATTNSTNTITCPNNDCNFVAGDVGKSVWVTQRGSGAWTYNSGAIICGNSNPVPTIATVNGPQSISITGSPCTANVTATGILVWGHKDGATLHALPTPCMTIYYPGELSILIDDSFFIVSPPCASSGSTTATGVPQPSIIGQTTTNWIVTPDFNYAHCTGNGSGVGTICVGSALTQIWQAVFWGTGGTNNTNCPNASGKTFLGHNPVGGAFYFVNLSGICPGQLGFTGAELNTLDDQWNEGGVQNVGLTALAVRTKAANTQSLSLSELGTPDQNAVGLQVGGGDQLNDYGSYPIACANITGTFTSRNTYFVNGGSTVAFPCRAAVTIQSGGLWYSDGDFVNQVALSGSTSDVGISTQAGGKATLRNTTIGATSGAQVAISNGGVIVDGGGNSITSGVAQMTSFGSIYGIQIIEGVCTGTATSSASLALYGALGQRAIATCTVALSANQGTVYQRPGTLVNMAVSAATGGVNASSGLVTVYKNGVATTSTCTLGTGTSCQDFTHTVTISPGDIIAADFTTQAAETLAGVKVAVTVW